MQAERDIYLIQNIAPDAPREDTAQQLAVYLQTLAHFCTRLPLAPLDPTGRESAHVTLEQVYVGLDTKTPQAVTFEGQRGEVRAVLAAAASQKRLVILGDPGSGKSTFLRFLALRLAQGRLAPDSEWQAKLSWPVHPTEPKREVMLRAEAEEPLGQVTWPHPAYVPVLVTLRDFAATDFDPNAPLALWHFIKTDLAERGLADSLPAIREVFCRGEGIFLLDGVDEVPLDRRPQVWQAIGALAESAFNRCPWLATCRTLSYVTAEAAVARATGQVTLAPLRQAQIDQFVTAWYDTLAAEGQVTQAKGQSLGRQLSRAATDRLQELAENPMLLTIIALVQTYYGTLPEERAKLYQACVETLLLRWQQSKEAEAQELPARLAQLELKPETIERLLWTIGWAAHAEQAERQGAADISEQQVIELAKKHLGSYAKAEAFVEYTERRAHLLIGRRGQTDRRYSFPHRTFQEYLAGCHLANDRRFGRQAIPLAEAGGPWREVLLLAAGTLVYNQKVGRYVLDALEDILPANQPVPGDRPGWQRVWRAGEMLAIVGLTEAEADEVGRELLPRVRRYLAALLTGGELTPPERAMLWLSWATAALGWA